MRRGFTLVECMVAGAVLVLAATTVMKGIGVLAHASRENAKMLEADAVVWDELAAIFNLKYEKIREKKEERQLDSDEAPLLTSSGEPVVLTIEIKETRTSPDEDKPLKLITATIVWGKLRESITRFVYRSAMDREESDET